MQNQILHPNHRTVSCGIARRQSSNFSGPGRCLALPVASAQLANPLLRISSLLRPRQGTFSDIPLFLFGNEYIDPAKHGKGTNEE